MSRDDGFPVMDVSTDFVADPKWRRLHRSHAALLPVAFLVYTATLCESWKAGRRVTAEEAWPAFLAYDAAVIDALRGAGFLDKRGLIVTKSWDGWFRPAFERRAKGRDRWTRYNDRRDREDPDHDQNTALVPRGNRVSTARVPRLPSVRPSVRPSVPTIPSRSTDFYPVDEQSRSAGTYPPIGAVKPLEGRQ